MDKSPRMLEGYRVLDFTHFVAGPTCTRILAEMGADVIKVERSMQGDHVRLLGLVRDGMSSYYFQHNHSKRSLALDFQKPEAKELVLKLIPKIDVYTLQTDPCTGLPLLSAAAKLDVAAYSVPADAPQAGTTASGQPAPHARYA